jgi:hypothetical protein
MFGELGLVKTQPLRQLNLFEKFLKDLELWHPWVASDCN